MGSAVRVPRGVKPPFDVYVNGVRQTEGRDYVVQGDVLRFERSLAQEGRLGLWRWFLGAWGIGTYRPHHAIDIAYTRADGQPAVAQDLPVEGD
ncbi:MAG TPA: hypothetical protein VFR97_12280 [Capillimicrobium sp.]|nr:hypothetical protein [Capillimicrobium sp.]